jgi:Zn-dependent protease with chaperone function
LRALCIRVALVLGGLVVLGPVLLADGLAVVEVPVPDQRVLDFHRLGNLTWLARRLLQLLLPLLVLVSGLSAGLRDRVASRVEGAIPRVALFVAVYTILTWLVGLPLDYWSGYRLPHEFGLSEKSLGRWAAASFKRMGLAVLLQAFAVTVVYEMIRTLSRRAWVILGLLSIPVGTFFVMLRPIWVAPLFNEFRPLRDRALAARILEVAERSGILGAEVLEVDKSRDTKAVNAYVAGLFGTTRIVLWDTIFDKLSPREIEAIMAHEIGHHALGHRLQGTLTRSASKVLVLGLVALFAGMVLRRWGARLGVRDLEDVASFPLLLALYFALNLALDPLLLWRSRIREHQADVFAVEQTGDPRALATAFLVLQGSNLKHPWPGPLYTVFRASHPSIGSRMEYFNEAVAEGARAPSARR